MASVFTEILSELVGQIPGALGAIFLDWEGEAVDQFSHIPRVDIQIAGAHWGIVWKHVVTFLDKHRLGDAELIILNCPKTDFIIRPLTEEYALVLAMRGGTHLATALRALDNAVEPILAEM